MDYVVSSGWYDLGSSQTPLQVPLMSFCSSSCFVSFDGTSPYTSLVLGVEHVFAKGRYIVYETGTIGYCSPDTGTSATTSVGTLLPNPTCPVGKSVGYVNGKPICYADSTSTTKPPPVTSGETTVTGTNANGEPTSTTTKTNSDGSTSTTKTTHGDGTTTSTTTTQQPATADKTTFCNSNPADPSCQSVDPCLDNPDRIGCAKTGTPEYLSTLGEKIITMDITPPSLGVIGFCPADRILAIPGTTQTFTFSFAYYCEFAERIRPVILALAWVSAALFFFAGV